MHVILTHEQGDFDALGAMLGAALLNEEAIPVIPRRMNRNARSFLSLYGAELPFVEPRDLPGESIDMVTLVDTQSMITLKGMSQRTGVHVIDHHKKRSDLPEGWTVSIESLGSCTTIFVEALRDHNGALSMVHATLLLLGIYEDTGSLTYAGTTPRDIHAAGYLLEQGASLRIASDYLNTPLSADQRQVYDRLLAAIESHHVYGENVMIACARADDLSEEISSVAHKLRDLLDPDALLLLVSTPEGIRLVARSTTDQINVASIAAHFGGGGHERAAAALIKPGADTQSGETEQLLNRIYQELLRILPEHIHPTITVGQIMSRQPLLLTPKTTTKEAAQLMQRYGYEGYPVVENGKVIGLLTRRAVDRALAHKLNLPAASLMEAGEVTVRSQDALEHLQRVMTSSGWGQVPVLNPNGEVIGIVTRTDLFKTMAGSEATLPGRQKMDARLEAAMPPARLALLKMIAEQAHAHHSPIYIVGGFVRDMILERASNDFDLVVEGDAIKLARSLVETYGGRLVSHSRFGTAKWWIADVRPGLIEHFSLPVPVSLNSLPDSVDLISSRTEFYDYPTALPTVERGNIKLDLHRRDFTINTMALRLDGRHYGELYDYWGGLSDLRQGLVRVLHSLSFVDDPTRILRAVRFEKRFNFQIEARTRQLMSEADQLLKQVSGERLRHEIDLILAEEHPAAMLERLRQLDLLSAIHPDLTWDQDSALPLEIVLKSELDPAWGLPAAYGRIPTRRLLAYLVWLGRLPVDKTQSIAERLRFSSTLRAALAATSQLWQEAGDLAVEKPSRVVSRLASVPIISLYALYRMTSSSVVQHMLSEYMTHWRNIHASIEGNNLQALGIKPGPAYRTILNTLRSAWLDGQVKTIEEEKTLLEKLIRENRAGT